MRASRIRIAAAAFSLAGWVAVLPVGVANADCTGAGDFGAGAGCAPPGSSSGSAKTESWPPTSVDWPPQLNSDSGSDNGSDNGNKGGGGAKPTPIVMPSGQKPPPATPASGFRFDNHLHITHADRSGGLGLHWNDDEYEHDTDPDRDSARLALS